MTVGRTGGARVRPVSRGGYETNPAPPKGRFCALVNEKDD
jgi:hypothetical protein